MLLINESEKLIKDYDKLLSYLKLFGVTRKSKVSELIRRACRNFGDYGFLDAMLVSKPRKLTLSRFKQGDYYQVAKIGLVAGGFINCTGLMINDVVSAHDFTSITKLKKDYLIVSCISTDKRVKESYDGYDLHEVYSTSSAKIESLDAISDLRLMSVEKERFNNVIGVFDYLTST